MKLTKYLYCAWETIGVIPQTSLWTISKHCEARVVGWGKGRTLLLPSLHDIQSKERSREEHVLFPNNPELNKLRSTSELGWTRCLCHILCPKPSTLHAKESKGKLGIIVERETWRGKSRPTLGPFAIIFPDTWSCITQPEREKLTLQLLSTN